MARLAHAFAFLLIILFSAGSLVALAGDALTSVIAGWESGRVDIPSSISVGVSLLLVPCMDVAMLYAASMLRLLATRQATRGDMLVHVIVLSGVAVVESATYVYMAWEYEHPATLAAWALIIARALAAPLVGVYLSMARALPVTPRDILYQVDLASGGGVLRDVVTLAHDPGAPLAEKAALYDASAIMGDADRDRLRNLMRVAQRQAGDDPLADHLPLHTGIPLPAPRTPPGGPYPTGGGTPLSSPVRTPGEPGFLDSQTIPSLAALSPVRTSRSEERRAEQETLREERIAAIVEWMYTARANGRTLSVRWVKSRLERRPPRKQVSESYVQSLMRIAKERINMADAIAAQVTEGVAQ